VVQLLVLVLVLVLVLFDRLPRFCVHLFDDPVRLLGADQLPLRDPRCESAAGKGERRGETRRGEKRGEDTR
jgi:hypothetical protein